MKDNIDLFSKVYFVGDQVICEGKVRKLKGNFCLDIIYIKLVKGSNLTSKKINFEELVNKFEVIVDGIIDPDYRRVIENCFDEDVKDLFFSFKK